MQRTGNLLKFPVESPEGKSRQDGRRKKMDIHVSQPFPHEMVSLDEREHFFVLHGLFHRESFQKGEEGRSVFQVSASELAYDEWMAGDLTIIEQACKVRVHFPQMRDPYGRINKNHSTGCPSAVST